MSANVLILVYCTFIVLASWIGGWLPSLLRLSHTRMQIVLSFVGGLMLGVGLLHLLPHGVVECSHGAGQWNPLDLTIGWAMIGLLGMFFLIRILRFHQHGTIAVGHADHSEEHGHDHEHGVAHQSVHKYSWVGVAFGLALHSLTDGVALGAAVVADAAHEGEFPLYGFGVFLAVFLHKPLDAFPITSLMAAAGWSDHARQLVNAGYAMTCPAGAALVVFGVSQFADQQHVLIGCALGFSAGVFLCISLGDLLPEVQFHAHDRLMLSAALILGVALAYGIGYFEPEHVHGGGLQLQHQNEDNHDQGHSH